MLGVMAVQRILKPGIHYAVTPQGNLAVHLESAYDAFRAHVKRIDYDRELVDLKAMRRMVAENRQQDGCVLDEGRKVAFGGRERRRAVVIDFAKTTLFGVDDFPTDEGEVPRETFRPRYGWTDPS
jgi:hypothetical protein